MFRSPMSPASVCTSRRNSSRSAISSGDNGAATETFFPGIRTPNHQSSANTATTAPTIRETLSRIRRNISSNLLPEEERAEGEEQDRHDDEDEQVRPVLDEMCAAEDDGARE